MHWCSAFPRQTEFNVPIKEFVLPPWTHVRPIVSLQQPKPLEEQKKGPGGVEVTLRILEVQPCWPERAGVESHPAPVAGASAAKPASGK